MLGSEYSPPSFPSESLDSNNSSFLEDRKTDSTLIVNINPLNLALQPQQEVFKQLKEYFKENKFCFDCKSAQTTWASVYLGIFICLNCAGKHRGLGTHISFVRSVDLDKWSIRQMLHMIIGGNARAKDFVMKNVAYLELATPSDKYSSRPFVEYKDLLKKEVDNLYKQLEASGKVPAEKITVDNAAPLRGYERATSISSDQYFSGNKETKKRNRRCGCC